MEEAADEKGGTDGRNGRREAGVEERGVERGKRKRDCFQSRN